MAVVRWTKTLKPDERHLLRNAVDAIGKNGVITITYNSSVGGDPSVDGQTLVLNPTPRAGSMEWSCTSATGIVTKYRPSECR